VSASARYSPPARRSSAPAPRRTAGGAPRAAAPRAAAPKYSGPPPPSATLISQLYDQLGGVRRRQSQLGADYNFGRSQLSAGRDTFLKQLASTYSDRQNNLAADYANRGLAQSGLLNEALAQLARDRAGEQANYETDFRGQMAQLLRQTTQGKTEANSQASAIQQRYNQARADRARILKLMGG